MISGIVALIGRPNVGKSTLFNRLIKQKLSIVDDTPGVTRDRIYGKTEWLSKEYLLIDTGGISLDNLPFQKLISYQANIAIDTADVIVFILDGATGVTDDDMYIASLLYKQNKPVIVAVSKVDDGHLTDRLYDFYSLGLGDPIGFSGLHGIGIGNILDRINELVPEKTVNKAFDEGVRFCIIGRPNVGKSSLVNAILNEERSIVSPIEGTTRDAVDTTFKRNNKYYTVVDTAGLRRRGNIPSELDRYANIRTLNAIENSDIVLLLVDGQKIVELDKNIVGFAYESEKPIIIVVNKWDLVEKGNNTMADFTKNLRFEFQFLTYSPVVYISALEKKRIHTIFEQLDLVLECANRRIQTSVLNDILMDLQMRTPASNFNGGRVKIYYGNQVSTMPPTFVLFVNNDKFMHFSYLRHIENRIRQSFDFTGTPLKIILRNKAD